MCTRSSIACLLYLYNFCHPLHIMQHWSPSSPIKSAKLNSISVPTPTRPHLKSIYSTCISLCLSLSLSISLIEKTYMSSLCKNSMSRWSLWVATFCLCFLSLLAELQRFEHPIKDDGSLNFLVIGDWGRRGTYNQSQVAFQMGRIGEKLNINFVVSTGDNFYDDGLKGVDDPTFDDSFTKIYTAKSLQKQWYSVLGNHDYRGDVEAQLSPILRRIDSRWLCSRSFLLNTEIAEFFFVDTTPFVDKYFEKSKNHTYDWRGIIPRKAYLSKLLEDLELALRDSNANWKIVVGHHTIRSIGHHGETKELVNQLLPILEANNVDMYINGHDHCLEHMSSRTSPIQFLTSGGGSKAWNGDIGQWNRDNVKFYYDGQGFMSLQLTPTEAEIVFYDIFGTALHNFKLSNKPFSAM